MSSQDKYLFYSDYNCPFCYTLNERIRVIGRSRFVEWRGIQHLSTASSSSISLDDQAQIVAEVTMIRKRAPEISLICPDFRPKTLLANRLTLLLSDQDIMKVSNLRTLIYRAYWLLGLDISKIEVLKELCQQGQLQFPTVLESDDSSLFLKLDQQLDKWHLEWQGEPLSGRLPVLVSVHANKPLLGFPTLHLLRRFLEQGIVPIGPENLASCRHKAKQAILIVSSEIEKHFNIIELRVPYDIFEVASIEHAKALIAKQQCLPDVIILDQLCFGDEVLDYCLYLSQDPIYREISTIILQNKTTPDEELRAFDAGAVDVLFDLSNAKICQTRFENLLRTKKTTEQLSDLARIDYLTTLPNRLDFDLKIEDVWLHSRRMRAELSLIFIDIDHFKNYNDAYGHSIGDDCLRQVALAMKDCLKRPSDTLARYGGEEFVVLLRDTPLEGAKDIAYKMGKAVQDLGLPHKDSSVAGVVTISLGVACLIPDTDNNPQELITHADEALYLAKNNGRNRVEIFNDRSNEIE